MATAMRITGNPRHLWPSGPVGAEPSSVRAPVSSRLSAMETTWDGLPAAGERPSACCVVVWREGGTDREFLVLHRVVPGGAAA